MADKALEKNEKKREKKEEEEKIERYNCSGRNSILHPVKKYGANLIFVLVNLFSLSLIVGLRVS